jgi:outer membrane protein
MSRLILVAGAAIPLLICLTPGALAQEVSEQNIPESHSVAPLKPRLPLWEAGVLGGGITQPAYPGADERASLVAGLPLFIYRGEYLRVDRGTVGVRAIKTPRTEVDVGLAASLGSRAADSEARRGMDDLGTLLEFGPRLNINLGDVSEGRSDSRIQLALRSVFDANDHFRYRGITFEPQWVKDMRFLNGWLVSTNLGAVFGDQKLVDTFYRVAPSEAIPARPSYEARSGLVALRASLFASRLFTPDVRFFSYLRLDSVQGAANQGSPLVRRDNGWTVGLGFAWTLAHSERSAKD